MALFTKSPPRVSPYVALIPVLAGVFIAADDQTVVVTVLPQIMQDMKVLVTELDRLSWTVTGYLLGYLAAMPLIGRLSDTWGHRPLFVGSMAGFMVGSVAVALAPNLELLIVARVFQAVGAGALVPISIAIAGDLFPAGRRALPLGLIGASAEAGGVIGPLWGGLIPDYMDRLWANLWSWDVLAGFPGESWLGAAPGWKWVFWINIPLAIAVLLLVGWLLGPSPRRAARVDYAGGVLIAVSLAFLTLGLARIDDIDMLMAAYLLGAGGALWLFVLRQRTFEEPLLPGIMFRATAFSAANATHLLVGGALIIAMVTIPLMANTVMGLSPLDGGLWLMRLTAAIPVGAVLGGLASQRMNYRVPTFAGLLLTSLGFLLMAQWDLQLSDPELTIHLALTGMGFGLLIAPIGLAATESVGEDNRGTAAAFITANRMVGMTLGLAALTAWGSGRFVGLVDGFRFPLQLQGETGAQYTERLVQYEAQVEGAGMNVFNEFFVIAMVVCLIALVPVALMDWRRGRPLPT